MSRTSIIALVLALAGCPEFQHLDLGDAGGEAPVRDAWLEQEEPQAPAQARPTALPQEQATEPDAGPEEPVDPPSNPGAVSYDFEGWWDVTTVPDASTSTCDKGVKLPVLTERWLVLRKDGFMSVDRRDHISQIKARLVLPNTFELIDGFMRPEVPVVGAIHWTVEVSANHFEGRGWAWNDALGCGSEVTVVGDNQ